MKLPLYFKTSEKSSCPQDGKSKPSGPISGNAEKKKAIYEVENSIGIFTVSYS